MAQQTAVDWFADEILKAAIVFLYNEKNEGKFSLAYDELIEQAKQMEKEQKMKFAADFFRWWWNQKGTNTNEAVEQYYNETFNQ